MIKKLNPDDFEVHLKRVREKYPDAETNRIGIVASSVHLTSKIDELIDVINKQEKEIDNLKVQVGYLKITI